MSAVFRSLVAALFPMLLFTGSLFAYAVDDAIPEVTDRVARISFIRGDVKIRRSGVDEWEKADLNLPVVEGDEVSTGADSRVEIQFGTRTHLRADNDSFIQIKQLSDQGIAVSLSTGTASVRLRKFDKDKEFFEIDAPNTTLAVQKEGYYRIDAGNASSAEVRVSVTEGGEARVYSANSGFTLRSGRSAKVYTQGTYAGEWETSDADRFTDEFDSWAEDRDELISKRVASANYDTYYDQDIYGAEDLNDNGSWEYTRDYGYVWRPYVSAINVYRDWSPYRYGSWRWVPPFGWTWVNDEPWGWATYHHGRWIWYHGRWVWTPYGYYRSNRSWWYPALVVIRVINRNICWYPLPYHYSYYNYNRGYHDWVGNRDRRRPRNDGRPPGSGGGNQNPLPVQPPPGQRPPREREPFETIDPTATAGRSNAKPIESIVPETGVISVSAESFGVSRRIGSPAPPEIAKTALTKIDAGGMQPVELPKYEAIRTRPGRDFTAQPPTEVIKASATAKTGAGERRRDVPLDQELMKSRILGDRPPVPITPEVQVQTGGQEIPRRTGAVGRPAPPKREIIPTPIEPRKDTDESVSPVKITPRYEPPPRRDPPTPKQDNPTPRFEPPPRRDPPTPKQDNPTPRFEPPPRRDPPTPKQDSPPPRRDPPTPKQEAPKSEPRPEKKPDPPSPRIVDRKKDPGR